MLLSAYSCNALGSDKRCAAPPFGDTTEAFRTYLQTHFKARGTAELACLAKFNHVGRERFYALGIADGEIDSQSTTELAAHYFEELGKQQLRSEARPISVTDFVLDGKQLASKQAAISLSGSYIKRGNIELLYSDGRSLLLADGYPDASQPSVALLTEDAPREFRKHLLSCQMNSSTAQLGCPLTITGIATICMQSNAFGTSREVPCINVIDGQSAH